MMTCYHSRPVSRRMRQGLGDFRDAQGVGNDGNDVDDVDGAGEDAGQTLAGRAAGDENRGRGRRSRPRRRNLRPLDDRSRSWDSGTSRRAVTMQLTVNRHSQVIGVRP